MRPPASTRPGSLRSSGFRRRYRERASRRSHRRLYCGQSERKGHPFARDELLKKILSNFPSPGVLLSMVPDFPEICGRLCKGLVLSKAYLRKEKPSVAEWQDWVCDAGLVETDDDGKPGPFARFAPIAFELGESIYPELSKLPESEDSRGGLSNPVGPLWRDPFCREVGTDRVPRCRRTS